MFSLLTAYHVNLNLFSYSNCIAADSFCANENRYFSLESLGRSQDFGGAKFFCLLRFEYIRKIFFHPYVLSLPLIILCFLCLFMHGFFFIRVVILYTDYRIRC
jgi:hypothetical protein